MKRLWEAYQITLSFFTTIPVFKHYEWTKERMRYVPMFMSYIGIIIGSLLALIYYLFNLTSFEHFEIIVSFIILLFFVGITGGLHLDALMDTADSFFSRRDIERKLEIMTDSRVGAFAVIVLFFYLSSMWLCFYLYTSLNINFIYFIFIPIYSRLCVGLMNYNFPYAKKDGLARMYEEALVSKDKIFIWIKFIVTSVILIYITNYQIIGFLIPCLSLVLYVYYYFFTKKNFNGITGDLLGNFIMISELMLFISVIISNLV